jgi:hypothetical protein
MHTVILLVACTVEHAHCCLSHCYSALLSAFDALPVDALEWTNGRPQHLKPPQDLVHNYFHTKPPARPEAPKISSWWPAAVLLIHCPFLQCHLPARQVRVLSSVWAGLASLIQAILF